MRTIYKYRLPVGPPVRFELPRLSTIVHVAMDKGAENAVYFWVDLEGKPQPEESLEVRTFFLHGTGGIIDDDSAYIGTAVGSMFVWHMVEVFPA